jgi:hypothetical protein
MEDNMAHRSVIRLGLVALTLLAALALPGLVLAGGVVVTVDGAGPNAQSGVPFNVGFTIRSMHDGSDENELEPVVTFTNKATGEVITVTAKNDNGEGHYSATVTVPSEGEWAWEIQPLGRYAENYPASVMAPLMVQAPAAERTSATTAGPAPVAAQPGPAVAVWPTLAGGAGLAALALWFVRMRQRAVARS